MAEFNVDNDTPLQPAAIRGLFVFGPPLALLIAALIFGGASRLNPIELMVVELFGLLALMPALLRSPDFCYGRPTLAGLVILGLTFALPILQLTPFAPDHLDIPSRTSAAGSGRLGDRTAKSLAQHEPHARANGSGGPVSIGARRNVRCGASMQSQAEALAGGRCGRRSDRSVGVGVVQSASGHSETVQFYEAATVGLPNGFFANRNHQASFMVVVIGLCAALLGADDLPLGLNRRPFAIMAAMLVFAVASAATLSRTGVILSGVMLVAALAVMQNRMHGMNRWLRFAVPAAVILTLCALVLAFKGGAVLERFQEGGGAASRTDILPGVIAAGRTLQPIGGGIGSFDVVYRAVEPLNKVIPEYLNHAHNDYVELWLEAGWPAVALITAMLGWWGYSAYLSLVRPQPT